MINFALIFNYIYLAIFGYQMLYFVVQYAVLKSVQANQLPYACQGNLQTAINFYENFNCL